jgi:hypothetical protein
VSERGRRLPSASLLTLICATVAMCCSCRHVALPTHAEGGVDSGNGIGAFSEWQGMREVYEHVLEADPSGRWLAALDRVTKRLRVWRLEAGRGQGELLLDTTQEECFAREAEWVGKHLVFFRIEGYRDKIAWELNPPENPPEYVARHGRLVAWDPEEGSLAVIATELPEYLLSTRTGGGRLAAFNRATDGAGYHVVVYTAPSFAVATSFDLRLEPRYDGGAVPVCWSADDQHVFMVSMEVPPQIGEERAWQVLLCADLHGSVAGLTNKTDLRLWDKGWFSGQRPGDVLDHGLYPTPVEAGKLVACTLAPHRTQVKRLGFFDTGGLVRAYPLERQWHYGPKELRQDEQAMHTITITPDGRRLILQETDEDSRLDYGENGWVWAWDYQAKDGQRIVRMPEITRTCGWLQEEYMIVQTDPVGEGLYAYGTVHVPKGTD